MEAGIKVFHLCDRHKEWWGNGFSVVSVCSVTEENAQGKATFRFGVRKPYQWMSPISGAAKDSVDFSKQTTIMHQLTN